MSLPSKYSLNCSRYNRPLASWRSARENIQKMKSKSFSVSLLILAVALVNIVTVSCSEISYSINVQNIVNRMSENFISYELSSVDIATLSRNSQMLKNLSQLAPCYVKLNEGILSERELSNSNVNKILISDMMKVFRYCWMLILLLCVTMRFTCDF